jgi:hypothetical protein
MTKLVVPSSGSMIHTKFAPGAMPLPDSSARMPTGVGRRRRV